MGHHKVPVARPGQGRPYVLANPRKHWLNSSGSLMAVGQVSPAIEIPPGRGHGQCLETLLSQLEVRMLLASRGQWDLRLGYFRLLSPFLVPELVL